MIQVLQQQQLHWHQQQPVQSAQHCASEKQQLNARGFDTIETFKGGEENKQHWSWKVTNSAKRILERKRSWEGLPGGSPSNVLWKAGGRRCEKVSWKLGRSISVKPCRVCEERQVEFSASEVSCVSGDVVHTHWPSCWVHPQKSEGLSCRCFLRFLLAVVRFQDGRNWSRA